MRVISYNVNGIRSAINKGFADWLATHPAQLNFVFRHSPYIEPDYLRHPMFKVK